LTDEAYLAEITLGVEVQHLITISTSDVSAVGKIIDAANAGGANRIQGITFKLSESKRADLTDQLLEAASKDASTRAAAVARGLGLEVGRPLKITAQTSSFNYRT
jgi:uncharacterized protein YggE